MILAKIIILIPVVSLKYQFVKGVNIHGGVVFDPFISYKQFIRTTRE